MEAYPKEDCLLGTSLQEPVQPFQSLIDGDPLRPWHHIPGDWRRPSSPERFELHWDERNRFGMVAPRPKDPWETLGYYETESEPYYTHRDPQSKTEEPARPSFAARLLMKLAWMGDRGVALSEQEVDRLCPRRPSTILDVGCGSGRLLGRCRELGHTVYGVEPDPFPRHAALAKGIPVYKGIGESLPGPIQSKQFDIIILMHVLHHCIDPAAVLGNVADHLAPGGQLICEVPN
jgi:SAM-dependent methyltransferase